jgi:hypothetical protein
MAQNPNAANPSIYLENNCAGVTTGDYLMVSSCSAATILRVANAPPASCPAGTGGVQIDHGTPGNITTGASQTVASAFPVQNLPTVVPFDEVTYYVGKVAGRWPALYRYSMKAGASEEVIDHVENMSVYYGVPDTTVTPASVKYLKADDVTTASAWSSVMNIRVQLLTSGDELNAVQTPQKISFGAPAAPESMTMSDTRYRQLFTATASLRDRLQ